jgi:hypothetical protein
MSNVEKYLSIKSTNEIKGVLNTINTEEYSLVNYVWTEYGFYPTFFNELFVDFFKEVKGPKIAFCFPGQEIFYEQYADILVTLEGFIDTTKAYKDSKETELLLNNFETISDRGIAFWYTLRNFDEDAYEEAFSGYEFRNILYPIGKDLHWKLGWPPGPGHKYAEGLDGTWYLPSCKYYEQGVQAYDFDLWNPDFKRTDGLGIENYNTFFVKNSWKTRNYGSTNINDYLVGKDGISGDLGFGSIEFDIYAKVVDFHIKNKINLVVINDLVKFPVVDNEYIHYLDMTGFLDVRLLLTVIDDSKNFINTGTSPGDLSAYYCQTNQVIVGDDRIQNRTQFCDSILGKRDKKVFRFHKEHKNYDELFSFLKQYS